MILKVQINNRVQIQLLFIFQQKVFMTESNWFISLALLGMSFLNLEGQVLIGCQSNINSFPLSFLEQQWSST